MCSHASQENTRLAAGCRPARPRPRFLLRFPTRMWTHSSSTVLAAYNLPSEKQRLVDYNNHVPMRHTYPEAANQIISIHFNSHVFFYIRHSTCSSCLPAFIIRFRRNFQRNWVPKTNTARLAAVPFAGSATCPVLLTCQMTRWHC